VDAESRWGSYGDKLVKPTFGLGTICEARSIEVYGGVAGSVHNDMAWHDDLVVRRLFVAQRISLLPVVSNGQHRRFLPLAILPDVRAC
jgi:hypothetical protein